MSAKVLIAIQARLNNSRLPGKCRLMVNGIPMLSKVIRAAKKSQSHMNLSPRDNIKAEVALLVPVGDPLGEEYRNECPVVEGPEDDVLTRYHMAMTTFEPDYVVRITSDCPLIPPKVITGIVTRAVNHNLDYVSNVDPEVRTAPDGFDCEVISNRLLEWTYKNAVKPDDREHVTTLIRRAPPSWAEMKDVLDHVDLSHLKLSVDTEEDYLFVCTYDELLNKKRSIAGGRRGGLFIV